ncbi:Uncharacterised protein [Corynebacterium kutscheri]|uniref:Uncharacterized protein n=1 Tax=Corynebacterium kutscheri TaxID=35755 RepID=A0A0F6TDU0_9CORY|nr:hypothetical protein UL82_08980 [Corynebacterium kutscheri]VEH06410.1 Uncharacterised protein [Corynebacterium kutscheri]VEH10278.1 Uncharacterised protein [Corynebacterium kutscheri]VEH82323.1 Uncharacterised protein [Corynebacterium kutscheri]
MWNKVLVTILVALMAISEFAKWPYGISVAFAVLAIVILFIPNRKKSTS